MHVGKLQAIGESLGVVIPRQQLRELGWQKGDFIAVEMFEGGFKLHSVKTLNVRFSTVDGRGRNGSDPATTRS